VIGYVNSTPGDREDDLRAFRLGVKEGGGYIEGENVAIEYRWGENDPDRLPALAADLARRRVLRHACGFALANAGHDTRALQAYLGHRNIQHTVRYSELAPTRFTVWSIKGRRAEIPQYEIKHEARGAAARRSPPAARGSNLRDRLASAVSARMHLTALTRFGRELPVGGPARGCRNTTQAPRGRDSLGRQTARSASLSHRRTGSSRGNSIVHHVAGPGGGTERGAYLVGVGAGLSGGAGAHRASVPDDAANDEVRLAAA
jgi:Phage integrase family